jgi:hypothetical protein
MAAAMDIVCTTGAELAFVSGVSQFALDDDLLHMQSKRVIGHGFSLINNSCKGLGVIHDAAVSMSLDCILVVMLQHGVSQH